VILLVSGATTVFREYAEHDQIGYLLDPASANLLPEEARAWAADNSAFSGFDEAAFVRMLDRMADLPAERRAKCLFVASPDVVGDARATLARFEYWEPRLRERGWPVALVGQDHLTFRDMPWERISAFFVGGSTEWKLNKAPLFIDACKKRGIWVHMGRVNTFNRMHYAKVLGCDSVDGSKFSRWSRTYIPDALLELSRLRSQRELAI